MTLVLHDWGGMIGLGWAARKLGRVKRLVLFNTAGFRLPAGKRLPRSLRIGRKPGLGQWLIRRRNLFVRCATRWCPVRKALPADVKAMYKMPYDTYAHRVAVWKFVETIPLADDDPGMDIVAAVEASLVHYRETPTLICWGMRDFVFDADFLAEWQRRLPDAEVQRFDDCGHYLLEDAPEVVARVRAFLGRT